MVTASFEECAGVKSLAGIISGQDSSRGKDHENCEEHRTREGSRDRSPEWRFGIRGERAESSKIESVHKLTGGQAVVQNCGDAFVGPARREVRQHEIHDVNQPE